MFKNDKYTNNKLFRFILKYNYINFQKINHYNLKYKIYKVNNIQKKKKNDED